METFMEVLTVVALLLALIQMFEARLQAKKLKDVKESLSTRYIGPFPEFLPQIVTMLQQANRKIVISCDCPSYGIFSHHRAWRDYVKTIEEKMDNNVKVSLTCPDSNMRDHFNREQFAKEGEDWDYWKKSKPIADRLSIILPSRLPETNIDSLTRESFLRMLEKADLEMLTGAFARAEKHEIPMFVSMFFWIIDDSQAIFSFSTMSEQNSEHGFYTVDMKLISAFLETRDRYHRHISAQSPAK